MPIIDDTVTGGFRQGEMVVFTGTSHNTVIVKTEAPKDSVTLTYQFDKLKAEALAKATGFVVSGHADYAMGNMSMSLKRFLEELLLPAHTWKTQSRFKQRPKKKVVKLHPILAGFTKQGKR